MNQRKQRRDEARTKESAAETLASGVVHGDRRDGPSGSGDDDGDNAFACRRRRSLFSSERLDLILSNLRRQLNKSADAARQCKQIGQDVNYSREAPHHHQLHQHYHHHQQQQQRGAENGRRSTQKRPTSGRHDVSSEENPTACGGDVHLDDRSDNAAPAKHVVDSSTSNCVNDDSGRRRGDNSGACHSHVAQRTADSDDVQSAAGAGRNASAGRRRWIKSMSFRAVAERSGSSNEDKVDSNRKSRILRSLRQSTTNQPQQQQQQQGHQPRDTPAAARLQASHDATVADGQSPLTVNRVLRERNAKQNSAAASSKRPQSKVPPGVRSTSASRLQTTQRDGDLAEKPKSPVSPAADDRMPRHRLRTTSVSWCVDLPEDAAGTMLRPHASSVSGSVDHLRQHQDDCRTTGVESKISANGVIGGNMLELEPLSATRRNDVSGQGGQATTLDRTKRARHRDVANGMTTASSTSAIDKLWQQLTLPRRTWSLRRLVDSPPKTNRSSEPPRMGENPRGGEQPAFRRSFSSQFRRSMMATTSPTYSETFNRAGRAVQLPTERELICVDPASTKTSRSVPLSERYRMLVGGDWLDNFPTSSATDVSGRKATSVAAGARKPLTLSRELKPDFVIYV